MGSESIDTTYFLLALFGLFGLLLFAGFIGLIALMVRTGLKRKRNQAIRTEQLRELATGFGFSFTPAAGLAAVQFLSRFEVFEGQPQAVENLMRGEVSGRPVWIFDLCYTNSGPAESGRIASRQTVCAVESPALGLPRFYLRPEGLFEKALNVTGRRDIDFDSHPAFSAAFSLFGDDENSIRAVFRPDLLSHLEKSPAIALCGAGRVLMAFRPKYVARPEELAGYVQTASDLAARFENRIA